MEFQNNKIITPIIIFLLSVLSHTKLHATEVPTQTTLKIAGIDWCPQICVDQSREGYIVELVKKVFEKSNYILDIDIFPWSRAILNVTNGLHTALLSPAKKEAPHLNYPKFSVGSQRMCFFKSAEEPWIYEGKESLANLKVGLAKDASVEGLDDFIKLNEDQFQYLPYHKQFVKQSSDLVLKSRIDLFVFTLNTTNHELKNSDLRHLIKNAGCVSSVPIYMAFTNKEGHMHDTDKLKSFFDSRIGELRESGYIKKLYKQYGIVE